MKSKNFIGQDGFIWFVGVVEDRADPTHTGRVRVRCLGYHTDNKDDLPTADLPWASPVLPITSSGISGIGQTPLGLLEGSWVFGFFRDSTFAQEPVIVGSLPGRPSEHGNPLKGFYDPRPREDDEKKSILPKEIDEPDTNRLAVNNKDKEAASLTQRKADRITGLATADFDAATAADGAVIEQSLYDTWDQPEIAYNSQYPYNHVYESESGHIVEFDDSFVIDEEGKRTNHYRIHMRHASGTSTEIVNNGDLIALNKNDIYNLTTRNSKVHIGGLSDITIGGRHKIYINKDGQTNNNYDIQVGPNANINIQVDTGNINLVTKEGNVNVNSAGNYNVKVGGNYTLLVDGNKTETIEGSKTSNTSGAVIHRGKTIDLNP